MEFHEKLQELRRQKGMTQEELAKVLYVSRTAISKWESGRGYPGIDSLKAIAAFFSVTVDQLLSTDQVLTIAEEEKKKTERGFRVPLNGLMDLCAGLLYFLPFFAGRGEEGIRAVSLLSLAEVSPYLRVLYWVVVSALVGVGLLSLGLYGRDLRTWEKSRVWLSMSLSIAAGLLFIVSLQPYPAVFILVLGGIKAFLTFKHP